MLNIIVYILRVQIISIILYIVYKFETHVKNATCITGLTWTENWSDMDCE